MHQVVHFLNLTTGADPGADDFWSVRVPAGVDTRFGACALAPSEREGLHQLVAPRLGSIVQ